MHKLLLSSAWNSLNISRALNMPEYIIYEYISNYASILNIPETTEVYLNVAKYASIYLTL